MALTVECSRICYEKCYLSSIEIHKRSVRRAANIKLQLHCNTNISNTTPHIPATITRTNRTYIFAFSLHIMPNVRHS